jgi:signal transduction histidine kinase
MSFNRNAFEMNKSIKLRIYVSFLLLVSVFVLNAGFTIITLHKNKKLIDHISTVVDPTLKALDDFHDMTIQSKMYSTNWVFLRASKDDKDSLLKIHSTTYSRIKTDLMQLSPKWKNKANKDSLQSLFKGFENILVVEKKIISSLQKFTDYDDPVLKMEAEKILEDEVIPQTAAVTKTLFFISENERSGKLFEEEKLEASFKMFWTLVLILAISILATGLILSKYLTGIIVKPINRIRNIINDLGKGVTNTIEYTNNKDEIGEMVTAVNHLSEKLRYTADFARHVGERNFNTSFEPLSAQDVLGKSLVAMRDNLKSIDESLNLAQHIAKLGSWEWDAQKNKVFWSDEMYLIFKKDPSSFTPDYDVFVESIHPNDRTGMVNCIDQSLKDHQPYSYECRISSGGEMKTIFTIGNVALDKNGDITKLYGTVQDITDRKKAEQLLKKSEVNLEIKNKELEQKNSELEQFAYIASHDLQEPLRTISSFSDRLQKQYQGKLDDIGQKYLFFIHQGTERMKTLIADLLEYSRIGRKKELKPVDCNEILNTVIADLDSAIQESRVEIKTDTLPVVTGYTTEIKQLFQNLVINAIKFRKKEVQPVIHINSQPVDGGWKFSVRDNGIGIDEQHSERIFVIFQRLHTRSEYEGSGIGLSHCKKIVELHGGKIWVNSKPGEGSTFHFTILENHN